MTRPMFCRSNSTLLRPPGSSRARRWPAVAVVTAGTLITMAAGAWPAGASPADSHPSSFRQINLVSDVPGAAQLHDADLVNAWGMAASPGTDAAPGSPLWVSDNGSGKTTLYSSGTATSVTKAGLTVNITSGAPTGQVFNADNTAFVVHDTSGHNAWYLTELGARVQRATRGQST